VIVRVEAPSAGRLDTVLADALPDLSRSRVAALVKAGVVQVDGVVVDRPSRAVTAGASLVVDVPAPVPLQAEPQDLPLRIVYQDEDLVVVDKAAGMVVHPGAGHPDGTLVNALLHHIHDLSGIGGVQRPGIVHRLDRGTSGLLVVAKHDQAHQHLAAQFAAHTAERLYLALVHRAVGAASGTVRSRLARHPVDRLRWASTDDPDQGREAVTHYTRLGVRGEVSLVQCQLETGRTHQVRVHLTELGHPLIGDTTYRHRAKRAPASIRPLVAALQDRPLLHAWSLSLDHPRTGDRRRFTAPLPEDMRRVVEALDLVQALPEPIR
jgi:23S rRNA pseudouridine1911/1915/1917 synthase